MMESWRSELQRVPGGTDELAEDGDVRTIHADTAGIDGEAETFGEIEIDTSVVELRKAVALRGRNTI